MTRLIEQGLNAPHCPWTGLDGGPIHPAHAVEVNTADRVSAAMEGWESAADIETLQLIDAVLGKVSTAAGGRPRMRLYAVEADPVRSESLRYFVGHYFRCLVCGFVLPAQEMRRG